MSDKIIIKNLKVFAHHGVLKQEKKHGQYFFLDLTLSADLSKPCRTDKVKHTVNYDEVCTLAYRIMSENRYDLIEKAAQEVCDGILREFHQVKRVTVTVRKPSAPVRCEVEYAAVTISRKRKHK